MDGIWSILELEPTQDVSAIKRAYARKSRACHPEEDPEGFLQLRKAYQAALNYAEGIPEPPAGTEDEEDRGWTLSGRPVVMDEGPNPYADHGAVREFLNLYTGKQRKNSKLWLDYFTSDAFLDIAWERRFPALLLEHITRLEAEFPVNREFLTWLCAAYQFSVTRSVYRNTDGSERTEFRFQIQAGAQFDGQESVFEISTKGPAPKTAKGNELAMAYSFAEYRRMVTLAEEGIWNEQAVGECSQILGRYAAGYITDKCQQRQDMDYERHPAGVRLITHFFRRDGIPEELYRMAWQKLDLKTAVMGRAKILYGALRELVLERLPELAGQQRESFAKLRTDFFAYAVSTCKRDGENAGATAGDIQKTDAFFAREDFQRALLDRRFVETEMLHTWVDEMRCDYYLEKVIQFYTEHETAPCARLVIDRAKDMLKYQKIAGRLRADRETEVPESGITLKSAPFFRHWLNTGFFHAQDRVSGRGLPVYLNQELPFLPEWSRNFLEVGEGEVPDPVSVACTVDNDTVEVRFHLRYMSFLTGGEQVYRPCLPWERAAALEKTDEFFFLLPITTTTYDQYETVKAEILRRLADTAAPEDSRAFIAGCLADQVCGLPLPGEAGLAWDRDETEEETEARPLPPESVLPFEVFAEDGERLFVCVWFQRDQVLALFQQTPYGRQLVRDGQYSDVPDARSAAALAYRLLQEQLFPASLPMEQLKVLPDAVYAQWDYTVICREKDRDPSWGTPVELLGDAVTAEKLEDLLNQFAAGRVQRLEWSWKDTVPVGEEQGCEPRRSLVILKDQARYACLCFDDFRAESYALLERPELYGKDRRRSELRPFGGGRLFSDVIHRSFSTIRQHLDVVFSQVSRPGNVKFMAGGIWAYAENVSHGRVKYNLDKQLLGGFPMERAFNRADTPFYFSLYPDSAACADEHGGAETLEVSELDRPRLQRMLVRFLQGGFSKLRMTWGKEEGRRRHIFLLQDGGRFLMAWLLEEKHTAKYHVADRWTYMDVEGKKYPKDTFRGRVTPAYLIHNGVMPLRNALELLLANLDSPGRITGKMAEYADEKPVKARPYEVIWAELADGLF